MKKIELLQSPKEIAQALNIAPSTLTGVLMMLGKTGVRGRKLELREVQTWIRDNWAFTTRHARAIRQALNADPNATPADFWLHNQLVNLTLKPV